VKTNFYQWSDALLRGDLEKIKDLYAEDATFLPTISSEFKKGLIGVEKYFKHFLEKKPKCDLKEDEIQFLGYNYYLHSGMYNFKISSGSKREIIKARFSFVWRLDKKNKWKIIHHHSSVRPNLK